MNFEEREKGFEPKEKGPRRARLTRLHSGDPGSKHTLTVPSERERSLAPGTNGGRGIERSSVRLLVPMSVVQLRDLGVMWVFR